MSEYLAVQVKQYTEAMAAYTASLKAPGSENNLRHYWLFGEGAAKIAWGTSGDMTRCMRFIDKHVGKARAARICAQWHHDKTGLWPGDARNV